MPIERKPSRYAHNVGHTDVCFSLDGSKIITCGTDGDIRIWSDFDDVDPIQSCVGEWALCVRQKEQQVYVATDNNDVQLVTFPEAERDGILVRFTAPANHIAVGKEHNMIAVVSEDMEVRVIDVTDTTNIHSFTGLSGPPLSVALSHDAKMIAVTSGDGFLRIWQVENQELQKEIDGFPKVNSFMNANVLSRIDFHPSSNLQLAYPLDKSVFVLNTTDWSEKFSLSCSMVNTSFSIVQYSPCGRFLAASSLDGAIVVWNITTQMLVGISEHPASVAICSMAWNPTSNGDIVFCDVQGEIGMAINCKTTDEITTDNMGEMVEGNFHRESDDEDDENVISLEKLKRETLGLEEAESDLRSESIRSPTPRPRTPATPLQMSFMPSSTPEHLNPRYLCWNEIGIVRSYGSPDDTDDQCTIEVDFHDTTFHNSMMMQNYQGYTMGTLSGKVLAVANASQVAVIPLNSAVKEWNLVMPAGEEIVCIGCSNSLVCVATNTYFVRVCSTYGIQKSVFAVPGPVVSMAAQNCDVFVVYHNAAPRNKDQSMQGMLVRLEGLAIEKKEIGCSLRPESTLSWLGFTEMGTPAMHDSTGILSLHPLQSNIWIPFCDTSKHTNLSDGFFVTAIEEKLQSVRGIRCKGSCYPSFIPRPVLSELPLQPVFAEPTTEKAQMESNLFCWSTLQVDNVDRKFKETALKSFALACKSGLDDRAVELLEMLRNPQLLSLCVKYAAKQNRRLAEKLMEMSSLIGDDDTTFVSTPEVSATKQVNRRLVIHSASKSTAKSNVKKKEVNVEVTKEVTENGSSLTESFMSEPQSLSESTFVNTDDSISVEKTPVNPFLKRTKQEENSNPLNLTDKFAGYEEVEVKENKGKPTEKRKLNDSDSEKQRGKQRKLDKFMFSKNN